MKGQKKFFGEDEVKSWVKGIYSEVGSMKEDSEKEEFSRTRPEIDLSLRAEAGSFPEKDYLELILIPVISKKGVITDYEITNNHSDLSLLGFSVKRNNNLSAGTLTGESSLEFIDFLIGVSNSGKARITEFYNTITDLYFQAVITPQADGRLIVLLQDKTRYQKNKLQVKHYADLYCKAEESSATGFFQFTASDNRILVSEGILMIFECPPQAVPADYVTIEQYLECVHEDDKEYVLSMISEDNQLSGLDFVHRIRIRNLIKYINIKGGVFYDTIDNSISMIGTVQDITDYMLLKEKLNFKQKDIDELKELTKTASWQYSFATDEFRGSACICNLLGISLEDFPISLGKVIDMLQEDERDEVYNKFQDAVNSHQDLITDFKLEDNTGNVHQIHMVCWTYYTQTGKPDFSRGYFIDQTDSMILNDKLDAQAKELQELKEELNILKASNSTLPSEKNTQLGTQKSDSDLNFQTQN